MITALLRRELRPGLSGDPITKYSLPTFEFTAGICQIHPMGDLLVIAGLRIIRICMYIDSFYHRME